MTKERTMHKSHPILKLFLLIVFAVLVVLCVMISIQGGPVDSLSWEQLNPMKLLEGIGGNGSGETENPFDLGELNIIGTDVYMDNLVVLTDNDIRLLNAKGQEVWYFPHEIMQPVLNVYKQWILIYERNGKSYMVMLNGKVLFKGILEGDISFGEIIDNRILFISSNEIGYKRTIHAISPDNGIDLGALYINDYYPFNAHTLDGDEKNPIILYGLGMNSNRVSTIIRLYDGTLKSSPIANVELDGLYPVLYGNSERKLFVGLDSVYCYSREMNLLWSMDFDKDITAAGIFENNGMVFALAGDENELVFFNSEGKEIKKIRIDGQAEGITVHKNTAAVTTGNEAAFYGTAGNIIDRAFMPGMTTSVHFVSEKKAFLVSEHKAVMHSITSKNLKVE